MFVLNQNTNTIGEYTTSGTTVNASLVTGLSFPQGIAVSGGDLFVENFVGGTVGEYNATTGAVINAALVTGLINPYGIAVSGGDLFVANYYNATVGEYTTSGATVNASLVTGLIGPYGLALSGGDLFVMNFNNGVIGEYTTSTNNNNSAADNDTLTPQANLEITTADNLGGSSVTTATGAAVPGNPITYTVVVTNAGPSNAPGASVVDALPSSLIGATYTAAASGGATGFTASGSGSIDDTALNLPAGSTVTYTIHATISPTATGTLSNTATVNPPAGVIDTDTLGATVNAPLVAGLDPSGIALSGSDLFFTNASTGTIGEYTTSGATC